VVRVKIVTQLEHDQLTLHGIMVHDHHPADPVSAVDSMAAIDATAALHCSHSG
jgi:hypothetical protein